MATYTYEVDHGDDAPRVSAGMKLNGGKVTAVQFDAALARLEQLEEIVSLMHIHSRKHTPGYCTVRQSDIDAIGNFIDPPILKKS